MSYSRVLERGRWLSLALAAATVWPWLPAAHSADPAAPAPPASARPEAVAATVNGHTISVAEVQSALAVILGARRVDEVSLRQLQAEVLDQLIDRVLVSELLARSETPVSDKQVDAALAKIRNDAAAQQGTLEQYLAQQHMSLAEFRKQLAWQIGWAAYVRSHLTDKALEAHFEAHRQEFDGTELKVRHILLRPDRGDPGAMARLIDQAVALRQQIEQEKLSFADAAKKHSVGPSHQQGGELGFIPRHGVMDENFSRTAFALKGDEISQPLVTSFGVHLINVSERKPGEKKWSDVREQLVEPTARDLYASLAQSERKEAKISFAESVPHFKPGTKELAEPEVRRTKYEVRGTKGEGRSRPLLRGD